MEHAGEVLTQLFVLLLAATQGLWPKDPVRIGRSVPHGVT